MSNNEADFAGYLTAKTRHMPISQLRDLRDGCKKAAENLATKGDITAAAGAWACWKAYEAIVANRELGR